MVIENGVKNIQAAAYNGVRTVDVVLYYATTASKYILKRPRICINWDPTFQTQIYLVKVLINVNIVKQDLHNKKQFLKILWSEIWKGGFQLMQILGLLGIYIELPVQYMKIPSLEHVVYTNWFFVFVSIFKTIYVHNRFWAWNFHVLNWWFNEQSFVKLWVSWVKNKCFWKRFTCTSSPQQSPD